MSAPAGLQLNVPGSPGTVASWFESLVRHHAAMRRERGGMSPAVRVAGVPLRLQFAGEEMARALCPAFEHHAATAEEPDFTILLWDSASPGLPMPPFPWRLGDVGAKGEVAAATGGSIRTAYSVGSRMLSAIDFERRLALAWTPDASALPWYEHAAPLRTLLHWILAASDRNLVHAAAVAPPGGSGGVLLAGRGGSGKSTTAMLCLGAGFLYAGDDYVAVSCADGSVAAHSLFATAKLSAASLEWLPFLRPGLRVEPRGDEKGVVMLADVAAASLAESFPLRALVVPRVSGGPVSRLSRTSAAEALRALAPTTLFQLPGAGPATFERLTSLARSLPAWSLELGRDFEAVPRLVAKAVEES